LQAAAENTILGGRESFDEGDFKILLNKTKSQIEDGKQSILIFEIPSH
jgi:hypothetical protein